MGIGAVGNGIGTNDIMRTNSRRVLGKDFNLALGDVNSGSKVNEPLMSFSNPKTGESIEIHRSDVYAEDNPLYILKGKTAEGDSFERKVHAWMINTRNCDYSEMMVLNLETGNTSPTDKARVDSLFDSIVEKGKEDDEAAVTKYLDKADYSTAMKDVLDEYKKSGNWDSYLSMDKWQQSIKDYTSVPVYFNRDIMNNSSTIERNGVKGACSFAKVQTQEEIEKEWADRFKEGAKNKTSIREVLKNTYPNAENLLYGVVGSSRVMTFDEYVKDTEEMLRELFERTNK